MLDRVTQRRIPELEPTFMKNIKVEVTLPELLLVTTLMSDQLFRREFIEPLSDFPFLVCSEWFDIPRAHSLRFFQVQDPRQKDPPEVGN